jgi:hypothetical protein
MGGKNKRRSIPSSSSVETKILERRSTANIEMTAENDYGVMSDPEENSSSPIPLLEEEERDETEPTPTPTLSCPEEENPEPAKLAVVMEGQELTQPNDDAHSYNPNEQSPASHEKQESSPSSQQQDPLIQPLIQPEISQIQSWSALETLQHKLTRDKNFSKKITLHTFFSYMILSIEIHRASVSSIRDISVAEVERLIDYMIENHSASEDIRTYLRKLNETEVITNMIFAVIDFNKDGLDKLFLTEQVELEMTTFNGKESTTDSSSDMMIQAAASASPPTTPPSSSRETRCGFFSCLRKFFKGCCG